MIKVHVLKVDMSVNDAKRLGYPKYLVSLNSTWEDSCENRWSFLNEQDIISCYPCQIVESNGRNKKEAWKIQLRGQEEPLYSLEVDFKKTLDEDYIYDNELYAHNEITKEEFDLLKEIFE